MADNENPLQTVIDAVDALLEGTSLTDYTELVINRLVSFGFTPTAQDAFVIAFAMQKTWNHILTLTNQNTVVPELIQVYADMTCGEILNTKHLSGQLNLSGLDFGAVVSSVHEGDTTVNFGSEGSDEAKFAKLVSWLMSGEGVDVLCYRKLRW